MASYFCRIRREGFNRAKPVLDEGILMFMLSLIFASSRAS